MMAALEAEFNRPGVSLTGQGAALGWVISEIKNRRFSLKPEASQETKREKMLKAFKILICDVKAVRLSDPETYRFFQRNIAKAEETLAELEDAE
jgi:hypothetical protein